MMTIGQKVKTTIRFFEYFFVTSMIFNLIYWVFGFLRMGTSGMTAQAWGGRDLSNVKVLLKRSTAVSLGIAALILLLQWPLRELMLWLIGPTADVRPLAVTYFNIVVWGAPAMLTLYSLSGWFIGMQNTRLPMTISILQNIINIGASLTLVYGYGMKMEGIALGTVIAQYAGLFAAIALLWHYYKRLLSIVPSHPRTSVPPSPRTPQFLAVNRDIFLRTLCLVAVNLYFTSAGARQGATILAVNTLMMQLFLPFSYIMDGFAYAGEALGGRYWGARHWENFRAIVGHLFGWGAMMTLVLAVADRRAAGHGSRGDVYWMDLLDSHLWRGSIRLGRHLHRHYPDARHAVVCSNSSRSFLHRNNNTYRRYRQPRAMAVDDALSGTARSYPNCLVCNPIAEKRTFPPIAW